jgi:lysine-N-methylase
MTLPIRALELDQRWDCHGCAECCHGGMIELDDEELRRLRHDRWHEHPDFRGVRIVVAPGLGKKRYRLAKRNDGRCVFLMTDGRCRIHAEHGPEAKPLICRMFPFQLVALGDFAYLTLRRSCPSAAAGRGRPLREHRQSAARLVKHSRMAPKPSRPPPIARRHCRPWKETLRVAESIERLMLDGRYPLVRRLMHGIQFCDLLQTCRLDKLSGDKLAELVDMLETSSTVGAGELFRERHSPAGTARLLFRQTALEYLRLHPKAAVARSWRGRWQLVTASIAMGRGRGRVPRLIAGVPETTFEALESPLGHLPQEVLAPLTAYFEASAASKQYAILGRPGWSIVESFRALAASHPVALWMLRLVSAGRAPEPDDTIGVVAAMDWGQGFAGLSGARHRKRITAIARGGDLARLVAWYAR